MLEIGKIREILKENFPQRGGFSPLVDLLESERITPVEACGLAGYNYGLVYDFLKLNFDVSPGSYQSTVCNRRRGLIGNRKDIERRRRKIRKRLEGELPQEVLERIEDPQLPISVACSWKEFGYYKVRKIFRRIGITISDYRGLI